MTNYNSHNPFSVFDLLLTICSYLESSEIKNLFLNRDIYTAIKSKYLYVTDVKGCLDLDLLDERETPILIYKNKYIDGEINYSDVSVKSEFKFNFLKHIWFFFVTD